MRFLLLAIFLAAVPNARALSLIQEPFAYSVSRAEVIVAGTMHVTGLKADFEAREYLRGHGPGRFPIKGMDSLLLSMEVPPGGSAVIIFGSRDSRGDLVFSSRLEPVGKKARIARVIQMQRYPSRFLQGKEDRVDLAGVIGSLFGQWQVVSTNKGMQRSYEGLVPWNSFPWDCKSVIRARGWAGPGDVAAVSVTSEPANDPVAAKLQQRLREIVSIPRNGISGPFLLTIDLRPPERAGDLTRSEALQYLRGLLETDDWPAVAAAIEALMRLRDVESIERIRKFQLEPPPQGERAFEYSKVIVAQRIFIGAVEQSQAGRL